MNDLIKVNAIVLKNMPVGEYDRLVTLLTMERGKISAFARSARKPASPLLASTLPFATGTFALYPGKSSYTINSTDIKEHFSSLLEDLEGISYGSYIMEVADYYTMENHRDEEMLRLIFKTLKVITAKRIPLRLIRYIFEIRSMVCEGEFPGAIPDIERAGILDDSSRYAISHICKAPLNELYTFTLSGEALNKLGLAADIYRKRVWDIIPKSLGVIESMENGDL